ncbi:MAG TPA: hypothetical protein VHM19_16630 [Polyangiales bacterium]|nr:hypothetical protein [Polyangiales bacterium]
MLGAPLEARVRATARRIRVQRALEAGVLAGIVALCGYAVVVLGAYLGGVDRRVASVWPWLAALPVVAAIGRALVPVPALRVAGLIDRTHALADLVSSAWAFGGLTAADQSPFMRATCERAGIAAAEISPARAAPYAWPEHTLALLLVGAGVLCLTRLPPRVQPAVQPTVRLARPPLLAADDVEALRADASQLAHGPAPEAVRQTVSELNQLLDAMSKGEIDRAAALAKLHDIEAQLEEQKQEGEEISEALRDLAKSLAGPKAARPLAEALAKANAEAARDEAQKLAQQARDAKSDPKRMEELQRSLLQRRKRELDRLDREKKNPETAQKKKHHRDLDKLDRDLNRAAENMQKGDRSSAGDDLEQAAADLDRASQAQRGAEQAQQLAERTQEIRELLRRMRQQNAQDGQQGQQGEMREAKSGEKGRENGMQMSRGTNGAGTPRDDGQQQGQQQSGGKGSRPQPFTLERFRALARGGQQPGQPRNQPGGDGDSSDPSSGAPGGGKPRDSDAPPPSAANADANLRVAGQQGKGASRSEIIYEAATKGFAARDYEAVHGAYAKHADSELERDEVPGGYRFYVRRYFQLIRPREDVHE